MKKFINILTCLIVAMVAMSCRNNINSTQTTEKTHEQIIADSIARAEFVRDSILKSPENQAKIASLKPLFNEKKDEFQDNAWVEPKTAPAYRNRNGVFCYFALKNGVAENFRFVFQYYADDWLFIRNMVFNIDGENTTIVPEMDTDCGNGGMIWEWCDESVGKYGSLNENFIKKLANAKSVKVKMNGSQYYDTKTLSAAQIKSIKDTYEYYIALGGRF